CHAGVGDFLARAMAGGAGLLHAEEALLHAHRATASAGVAGLGLGARLGARAMAGFTVFPAGHAELGVETRRGLLKGDVERIFQVGAAIHLRPASAAAAAEDLAKDVAEGVGKARPAHAARGVGVDARMAETIVGGALFLVAENLVGLFGLLEMLFRLFIARVPVGMIFHRELAVGFLELVVGGIF